MNKERLKQILNNFEGRNVLVLGDVMLDEYIWGSVERTSPEAPVRVVRIEKRHYALGGAANVANNLAELGANVYIVSIVGNDNDGEKLKDRLDKLRANTEGVFTDPTRPTITKTRIVAHDQQMMRIDHEQTHFISAEIEKRMIQFIKGNAHLLNGVIISDYLKGVLTNNLLREVIDLCLKK
ncbi:unnamed protein product [marine sediment metagenome]|uniref:Carbohydrate kinase PfkB domain-containing protein n=1 Tax=marine sediment metagenome TaxID=412755 RepID=X1UFA7_9ZZZZ